MRYGQIRKYDVANGPGIRTSIFVTGCPFRCEGCFNQEYQSEKSGKLWTKDIEDMVISHLYSEHVSGLSVLGGEPLVQDDSLLKLLKRVKLEVRKSVWLWTGFYYEQLNSKQFNVLEYVDVLVDGPFEISKKDLKLKFRGSSNQRIIDLKKTKHSNEVLLWTEDNLQIESVHA